MDDSPADNPPTRAPIVFGGGGGSSKSDVKFGSGAKSAILNEEKERHKKRAERFGGDVKEPRLQNIMGAMEAKRLLVGKEGFTTGFDLYSKDEIEKRERRAKKFGLEPPKPTEEELKEAEKKKRAERFGIDYKPPADEAMDVDLLEERKEASASTARREEALHLYGVDVLNTKEIYGYFKELYPSFVEWIDDSSCNVVFNDKHSAKRALKRMGTPMNTSEGDVMPNATGTVEGDVDELYVWHKGPPFEKDGVKIPLTFRIATVEDVKPTSGKHTTRRLWVKGKDWKSAVVGGGKGDKKKAKRKRGRGADAMDDGEGGKVEDLRAVLGGGGDAAVAGMRSDTIVGDAAATGEGGGEGAGGDAMEADDERPATRPRRGSDDDDDHDPSERLLRDPGAPTILTDSTGEPAA